MTSRAGAVARLDPALRPTPEGRVQLARAIAGAKMRLQGAAASNRALRVVGRAPSDAESQDVTGPLVTADPVIAELEAALAMRRAGANAKTLRGKLRRLEEQLDE